MTNEKLISIVSPCFNEAEGVLDFYKNLSKVLNEVSSYRFEIVFVDDGSSDNTLDVLNKISALDDRVKVFSFSKNYGHQVALLAGINSVNSASDALITLDSDLQHPPKYIPEMIEVWASGFEVISMVRRSHQKGFIKNFTSKLYYKLINLLSEVEIITDCADFTMVDRKVISAIQSMKEKDLFIRGIISLVGFNRSFIEYDQADRASGYSKYTFRKMTNLALSSLFSFSSKPIRISFKIGLSFLTLASVYLVYAIAVFFLDDTTPGWTSVMAVVTFFGGANLLALGLLGEYVSRIFDQVKERPRYIFKQTPSEPKVFAIKNDRNISLETADYASRLFLEINESKKPLSLGPKGQ